MFILLQNVDQQKMNQESHTAQLVNLELLLSELAVKTEVCRAGSLRKHPALCSVVN